MATATIIWTKIDEAPALATHALLPIVRAYTKGTGVEFEVRDISLAGRLIAKFPERLRQGYGTGLRPDLLRLPEVAKRLFPRFRIRADLGSA